jgi:hypothetical protein
MNSLGRRAVTIFLSGLLVGLPLAGSSLQGLVGVAQGTGTISINGQPFGGQASLFSGDRILTGAASPLTVISSPAEQFRFEPGTSAQVSRENQANIVRLNLGAVEFRTSGATKAELPDGVTVQPASGTVTLAQVSRQANGASEIAVYKGSVELADATRNVTVAAGHTAVIGADSSTSQTTDQNKKKHRKKVWAILITSGLTAGATAAILANEQTNFVSKIDP